MLTSPQRTVGVSSLFGIVQAGWQTSWLSEPPEPVDCRP